MKAIVNAEWVNSQLKNGELAVIDVRFAPGQPSYGRESYEQGHLPGAVFIDLKTELAAPAQKHGGRSPLPDITQLAATFGRLGIERNRPVVIYDDHGDPASARLWWILGYLGHDQVYVLDGGFAGWKEGGWPITAEQPEVIPRVFEPAPRGHWLADMAEVKAALGQEDVTLIDARDEAQYLGLEAPLDQVAGHIPGALHAFWKDGRDAEGRWKASEEQRQRFADIPLSRKIIVYCGSGISACPNVLALREAGYTNVKLYAGSWSDWISFPQNPVATGDEEKV